MPKLRIPSYQREAIEKERRNESLVKAVERGKAESNFKRDYMLANALGMKPASLSTYKKHSYQNMNFSLFCEMARAIHMTGKELCDAVGIPYEVDAS